MKGWYPDGTANHQIKHTKEAVQRKNDRIATGGGGTEESLQLHTIANVLAY